MFWYHSQSINQSIIQSQTSDFLSFLNPFKNKIEFNKNCFRLPALYSKQYSPLYNPKQIIDQKNKTFHEKHKT